MISFPINQVILADSVFSEKQKALRNYLVNFDIDRLMHTFRLNAGIVSEAEPLGGWESPSCLLRGHFVGHYLAACAKMAYALGDEACRRRAEDVVDILCECVRDNGYLSAFEEGWLDVLEERENSGVWAPYYTLDKLINGLFCCGKYLNNEKAVRLAVNLSHYISLRFDKLSAEKTDAILRCDRLNPVNEFGGIGDSLYSLWELTSDETVLRLAKIFDRDYFVGELSAGVDVLTDLHANTHLPQINAAMHRYHVTKEEKYLTAAKKFYEYLLPRTFANGNSSSRAKNYAVGGVSEKSEHWGGELDRSYLTGGESESCCAHNTERLLSWLLRYGDDKLEYLEHMERIKYNAVCNCASSKTGLSQYHQPMGAGVHKHFSSLYGDFWCCTGSGTEAMAELSGNIWFSDGDKILLNMFVPSRLILPEKGAELSLATRYPHDNEAVIEVNASSDVRLTLQFRADSVRKISINGEDAVTVEKDGFITVYGVFSNGDAIEISIRSECRRVPLGSDGSVFAVMSGNVLLGKISDGDDGAFVPLYEIEDEEYTVYMNASHSEAARDGSFAYGE